MVGRQRAEWEKGVGYFVNPVVLRFILQGDLPFTELLRQVQQKVLEALEYQDFPFGLLVERLQLERDLSRSPLFQVAFIWDKVRLKRQILCLILFCCPSNGGHRLICR